MKIPEFVQPELKDELISGRSWLARLPRRHRQIIKSLGGFSTVMANHNLEAQDILDRLAAMDPQVAETLNTLKGT